MVGANVGVSMPVFWLGLMLAYVFALLLKDTPLWLPPSGRLTAGLTAVPFYEVYGWTVPRGHALVQGAWNSSPTCTSSTPSSPPTGRCCGIRSST